MSRHRSIERTVVVVVPRADAARVRLELPEPP
jgi:hypothetical protein